MVFEMDYSQIPEMRNYLFLHSHRRRYVSTKSSHRGIQFLLFRGVGMSRDLVAGDQVICVACGPLHQRFYEAAKQVASTRLSLPSYTCGPQSLQILAEQIGSEVIGTILLFHAVHHHKAVLAE